MPSSKIKTYSEALKIVYQSCIDLDLIDGDIFFTYQPPNTKPYFPDDLNQLMGYLIKKHNLSALAVMEFDFEISNIKRTGDINENNTHAHLLIKNISNERLKVFQTDILQLIGDNGKKSFLSLSMYDIERLKEWYLLKGFDDRQPFTYSVNKEVPVSEVGATETMTVIYFVSPEPPLIIPKERKKLTFTDICLTSHFLTSFSAITDYLLITPIHLTPIQTMAYNQRFTKWLSISNNLLPPCPQL